MNDGDLHYFARTYYLFDYDERDFAEIIRPKKDEQVIDLGDGEESEGESEEQPEEEEVEDGEEVAE